MSERSTGEARGEGGTEGRATRDGPDIEPVRILHTEDHVLHSEHVGDDLHLWIAPPLPRFMAGGQGGEPASAPPVPLWILDGDLFFGMAVDTTRLMHRLFGELPPILVVGVAYGHDRAALHGELRNRDFTPTASPAMEAMGRRMNPEWTPALPEGRRMGRAPEFLRFLVDEARPYVKSRFQTAPGADTLFGSSIGGLFAAWSALAEPGSFDRVIAVSPALWWDDGCVLDLEERIAAERDDLPVELYLAAGSLEEPEHLPFVSRFRLISNARTLAERLASRGYPSVRTSFQLLEGETHTSVPPVALTRGLRALLGGAPAA